MSKLSNWLVEQIIDESKQIQTIVAIYTGRFQPFSKHHFETFKSVQSKFGDKNSYIATTNVVGENSPFSFNEKKKIIKSYGISNVVKVTSPYSALEILSKYNPKTTAVVFIVGEKDSSRLRGDYWIKYNKSDKKLQSYEDHGYFLVVPHVSLKVKGYGEMSGTTVRKALGSSSTKDKKTLFKDVFGFYDKSIYDLVVNKLEKINEDVIPGGKADFKSLEDIAYHHYDPKGYYDIDNIKDTTKFKGILRLLKLNLRRGIEVELEHTSDEKIAKEIAYDHLYEDPQYYTKLKSIHTEQVFSKNWWKTFLQEGTVDHSEYELKKAGLLDKDSDYGGMIGKAVLELMKVFASQGHSGMSAAYVRDLFNKLSNFKTLSPITSDPDEWTNVVEYSVNNEPLWQSKRSPATFSKDGGKTWYSLDEQTILKGIKIALNEYKELKNFVICEICNKKFRQITENHLKYRHAISLLEYRKQYPRAKLLSENLRLELKEKNPMNDERYIQKIKDTKLERYGNETFNNIDKNKETMLFRYGVENPSQLEHNKQRALKNLEEIRKRAYESGRWLSAQDKQGYLGYRDRVRLLTKQTLKENRNQIDNLHKRSHEWHLDHKYSIFNGFKNNIPEWILAHYCNIEIVHHMINESKNIKNSISIDELMHSILQYDSRELLMCGGAAGHMQHVFENNELTFGDIKNIINLGLQGQLDLEKGVVEKTDGQNLMVTWKDDKLQAARNKGQIKNPIDVKQMGSIFAGRGDIRDAFVYAMTDLEKSISSLSTNQKNKIFNNGRNYINLEIIYPSTANVINYDLAVLQFHGATEFDSNGNPIGTVPNAAQILIGMIQQVNQDIQNHFKIIKPTILTLNPHQDYSKRREYFEAKLKKLQSKFSLKDNDTLGLYHQEWWKAFISKQAIKLNASISNNILMGLVKRWAFNEKSYSIAQMKSDIKSTEFLTWAIKFDKEEHQSQLKKNMYPFEILIMELGAEILNNASGFLAANPDKAVQKIKRELDQAVKALSKSSDIKKLNLLKHQMSKINAIGGFDKIVPSEGLVFVYGGNTYKLTGFFAPANQILGALKFGN